MYDMIGNVDAYSREVK